MWPMGLLFKYITTYALRGTWLHGYLVLENRKQIFKLQTEKWKKILIIYKKKHNKNWLMIFRK